MEWDRLTKDLDSVVVVQEEALRQLETGSTKISDEIAAHVDETVGWANTQRSKVVRLSYATENRGNEPKWHEPDLTRLQRSLKRKAMDTLCPGGDTLRWDYNTSFHEPHDTWYLDLHHRKMLEKETRHILQNRVSKSVSLRSLGKSTSVTHSLEQHSTTMKKKWNFLETRRMVLGHAGTIGPGDSKGMSLEGVGHAEGEWIRQTLKYKYLNVLLSESELLLRKRDTRPHTIKDVNGSLSNEKADFLNTEYTSHNKQSVLAAFRTAVENRHYLLPQKSHKLAVINTRHDLCQHQKDAVTHIELKYRNRMNFIMADDPGTGKASAVMVYLSAVPGMHVIITPNACMEQWTSKIFEWTTNPSKLTMDTLGDGEGTAARSITDYVSSYETKKKRYAAEKDRVWIHLIAYTRVEELQPHLERWGNGNVRTLVMDFKHPSLGGLVQNKVILNMVARVTARHRILLMSTIPILHCEGCWSICQFLFPFTYGGVRGGICGWLEKKIESDGNDHVTIDLSEDEKSLIARRLFQVICPFIFRREANQIANKPYIEEITVECPLSAMQTRLYWAFADHAAKRLRSVKSDELVIATTAIVAKIISHPFLLMQYARKAEWDMNIENTSYYREIQVRSCGKLAMLDCILKEISRAVESAESASMHKIAIYTADSPVFDVLKIYLEGAFDDDQVFYFTGDLANDVSDHVMNLEKFNVQRPGVVLLLISVLPVEFSLANVDTLIVYDGDIKLSSLKVLTGRCRPIADPFGLRVIWLTSYFNEATGDVSTIDKLRRSFSTVYREVCESDSSSQSAWAQHSFRWRYASKSIDALTASFRAVSEQLSSVDLPSVSCGLTHPVRKLLSLPESASVPSLVLLGIDECPDILKSPLSAHRIVQDLFPDLREARVVLYPCVAVGDTNNDDVMQLHTFENGLKGVLEVGHIAPSAPPPSMQTNDLQLSQKCLSALRSTLVKKGFAPEIIAAEPLASLVSYCKQEGIDVEYVEAAPFVEKWLQTIERSDV